MPIWQKQVNSGYMACLSRSSILSLPVRQSRVIVPATPPAS